MHPNQLTLQWDGIYNMGEIDTFRSILVKVRAAFRCHTKECGQRYDISEQTFGIGMKRCTFVW